MKIDPLCLHLLLRKGKCLKKTQCFFLFVLLSLSNEDQHFALVLRRKFPISVYVAGDFKQTVAERLIKLYIWKNFSGVSKKFHLNFGSTCKTTYLPTAVLNVFIFGRKACSNGHTHYSYRSTNIHRIRRVRSGNRV